MFQALLILFVVVGNTILGEIQARGIFEKFVVRKGADGWSNVRARPSQIISYPAGFCGGFFPCEAGGF
ncbi:MAG: hypothetical protein ACJAXZ_001969 [Akkermansiaceae bacterium]